MTGDEGGIIEPPNGKRHTGAAPQTTWRAEHVSKLARKTREWRDGDDGWCRYAREALRVELTDQQAQVLVALKTRPWGSTTLGTAVKSGKGPGKTFTAAIALYAKLTLYGGGGKSCLVLATAPKERQLYDQLWGECRRLREGSPYLRLLTNWNATRITMRGHPNDRWYAAARTAKYEENISGFHADHMLVIIEEAAGVPDVIHSTLQTTLTDADNQILMIGQPTRLTGEFYKAFRDRRISGLWRQLTFNAEESSRVPKASIERARAKWGANSNLYKVNVLGEFPDLSERGMFPPSVLADAAERDPLPEEGEGLCWGLDVARFGNDHWCLVGRRGPNVLYVYRWEQMDVISGAKKAAAIVASHDDSQRLCVDEIGLGAGAADYLINNEGGCLPAGVEVVGVNVAQSPDDEPDTYGLLRDELWFKLSHRYRQGAIAYVDLDPDVRETLEAELEPVEYDADKRTGKAKVDSKDVMRSKIGHSPDIVDAIILSFYEGSNADVFFV